MKLFFALLVVITTLSVQVAISQEANSASPVEKRKNKKEVDLHYNFTHVGHKISLNYNHYFGRHAIVGGFNYHLATTINNADSRFKDFKFYSSRKRDRVGINLGYKYNLLKPNASNWLEPYLFYQLTLTRDLDPQIEIQFTNPSGLPGKQLYVGDSHAVLDNIAGVGVNAHFTDRLGVNAGIGGGVAAFSRAVVMTGPGIRPDTWSSERSLFFRLGLTYQLVRP